MKVTVHLARLVLDPAGLRDPHDIHQRLWRAFPEESARRNAMTAEARSTLPSPFMFRADRVRVGAAVEVRALVQSRLPPDWKVLGATLRSCEEPAEGVISWELAAGQRWGFYLRANPTRARKDKVQRVGAGDARTFADLGPEEFQAARGRRVGLQSDAEREAWLVRKLEGAATIPTRALCGADGEEVLSRELRLANLRPWRWRGGGDLATHEGADFQGVLRVDDPDRFAALLTGGVGPAKGLGFGLLSIRSVAP
ncbi:MAG: type I-E CRISPR-associated protein Cas6/Cse3/CasE [Polyangiales bacterium]